MTRILTDSLRNIKLKNLTVNIQSGWTHLLFHGWYNISIRMIQFCGKEIVLPLELLFKSLLEEGIFPEDWKKSNVLPFHK